MKTVLSFGAGLNSSALLFYLVNRSETPDIVIFSDTGDENPYTYETVEFWRQWCSEKRIDFRITKSHLADTLYDFSIKGRSIPSRLARECSFKFKVRPLRKLINQLYPDESTCDCDRARHDQKKYRPHRFHMIIGIARDEGHRAKDSDVWYIKNKFPLVDAGVDRDGCQKILADAGLPIPRKSGCFYCPFMPRSEWVDLAINRPELFDRAQILEENGQRYPELTLTNKPLKVIRSLTASSRSTRQVSLGNWGADPAGECGGYCRT